MTRVKLNVFFVTYDDGILNRIVDEITRVCSIDNRCSIEVQGSSIVVPEFKYIIVRFQNEENLFSVKKELESILQREKLSWYKLEEVIVK